MASAGRARVGDRAPVRVWDPLVRVLHWGLVASFTAAWLSANVREGLHIWLGYAAACLVAVRLAWGVVGPRYARFRQFVRPPHVVLAYLRDILGGRETRYIGHNPAGGAMIVALLLAMSATAFTGWLLTTDAYWGVRWMQVVHDVCARTLLALVGLHVLGVIVACLRHRENLVRAMFNGTKRAPSADDVV